MIYGIIDMKELIIGIEADNYIIMAKKCNHYSDWDQFSIIYFA